MPKRRSAIQMTDEETWKFLEERKSLQVATLNKDGSPHLTTLWFAIVDGSIVFETFTKSQKIKNLERDPRIALLVEDGLDYGELRGVSINGRAVLHADPETVTKYARSLVRRNQPGVAEDSLDEAAQRMARKRTVVVIKPDSIVTWDHRKLGGAY